MNKKNLTTDKPTAKSNTTPNTIPTLIELLVRIPSVSRDEQKAVSFLVEYMNQHGFTAHKDKAGNAIGKIGQGEEILLVGHIDTVPGDIPVRIEDNKLYGRGSVDAKGCLATFVEAARSASLKNKIVVVGAVEEEIQTSKGIRHLIGTYNPKAIIIGEPSGADALTLGYKGRLLVDYEIKIPMSHGSSGEHNAIEEAIMFYNTIMRFSRDHNKEFRRIFDQIQVRLQSIKTTADGLYQTAYMTVGFRLPNGFDDENFKQFLHRESGDACIELYGSEKAIKGSKSNFLVKAFLKSMRKHSIAPRFKVKTGTSDMNILGHAYPGVPILAYGPGDSSLDHTPNEHLDLTEYEKGIGVLKGVLEGL